MKQLLLLIIVSTIFQNKTFSQYTFGTNISQKNSIATFQSFDSIKGIRIPIVTKSRLDTMTINSSMSAILVYDITDSCFKMNNGRYWDCISQDTNRQWMNMPGSPPKIISKQALLNGDTIVITNDGEIGIGTSTPSEKLEIIGNIKTNSLSGSGTRMVVTDNNGVLSQQAIPANDHDFYEVGTTTSPNSVNDNIYTNGKVGIGTSSPSNSLNVLGSFTSGGINNITTGDSSFIAGGFSNLASGSGTFICGAGNEATGLLAFCSGAQDTASGNYSFVGGGYRNHASGIYSFSGGGRSNKASGDRSATIGGFGNISSGPYSFTGGNRSEASHSNSFVYCSDNGAGLTPLLSSTATEQMSLRFDNGYRFFTSSGAGAQILPGATSWTVLSDKTKKENYTQIDKKQILNKVVSLDVEKWNYRFNSDSIKHIGPYAQDFYKAFELGQDSLGIETMDISGVNMAAIQGLFEYIKELQNENTDIKSKNSLLKSKLESTEIELRSEIEAIKLMLQRAEK